MSNVEIFEIEQPYLHLQCTLGEGPFYEKDTGNLRFVDIVKKEIHSVNLENGPSSHRAAVLPDSVGVTSDIEGRQDEIIVAAKFGYAIYNKKTSEFRYVRKAYEDDPAKAERMRFNDGAVDTRGRFWAGSMNDFHVGAPQPEGTVFRLDPDLSLHRMIENVCIPNGMGWSPDDKTMYFTDSLSKSITAYDFEAETGSISNKRTFFTLDMGDAVPDGCTIDVAGYLWVAIHQGSCVLRVSPDGRIVSQVSLKAWKITCPVFGGPKLDELFITSAAVDEEDAKPEGTRDNGSVFRIKTLTTGLPSNRFVLQ